MKQLTRVLLVDGRPLLRAAMAALLSRDVTMEIIETHDAATVAAKIREVRPVVVLVGVDLGADLEALAPAMRVQGGPPFVAISSCVNSSFLSAACRAGFAGMVLASAPTTVLMDTINAVVTGKAFVDADGNAAVGDHGTEAPALSARERQVLKLLSEGQSTKQIASMLGLSGKTIETHRLRIMRKLQMFSVAELTKYAIRHGLTRV